MPAPVERGRREGLAPTMPTCTGRLKYLSAGRKARFNHRSEHLWQMAGNRGKSGDKHVKPKQAAIAYVERPAGNTAIQ